MSMKTNASRLYAAAVISWVAASCLAHASDSGPQLLTPQATVADARLSDAQLQAQVLAARRYATFWATGEETMARLALAPDFMDRTLPPGRMQGVEGPLAASKGFRAAVPDLTCEIEQMIIAGDRVVVHLHFSGHFLGRFGSVNGKGQQIDFIATDIYRVADGRIKENWHIEDNLTLLQQMGVVAK